MKRAMKLNDKLQILLVIWPKSERIPILVAVPEATQPTHLCLPIFLNYCFSVFSGAPCYSLHATVDSLYSFSPFQHAPSNLPASLLLLPLWMYSFTCRIWSREQWDEQLQFLFCDRTDHSAAQHSLCNSAFTNMLHKITAAFSTCFSSEK